MEKCSYCHIRFNNWAKRMTHEAQRHPKQYAADRRKRKQAVRDFYHSIAPAGYGASVWVVRGHGEN